MKTRSEPLTVSQAKVIRSNGTVEYHLSTPKLKWWDIKGRLWVWKRIKSLKKERN